MDNGKEKFSLGGRIKSTNHALRGIAVFFKTSHNSWLHVFFGGLAAYLGVILHISEGEWATLVLAIGLVIVSEAFNSAIERDMDLTSPEYHPYARDTKDMAAGAVAISIIIAGLIGLIIFLPKILPLIR
ncbi:MAG TPA: diacylglycerol kinase family protein [Candidatus Paceibacterota bacterium]|jgi:diacylglycerol kinase|nr:diacylglycerol kinase family protein [Candidatus Paceibacterota bacterium]